MNRLFFFQSKSASSWLALIADSGAAAQRNAEHWAQFEDAWQGGMLLRESHAVRKDFEAYYGLVTQQGDPVLVQTPHQGRLSQAHWVLLEFRGECQALGCPKDGTGFLVSPEVWRSSPGLRAVTLCLGFLVSKKKRCEKSGDLAVFEFALNAL